MAVIGAAFVIWRSPGERAGLLIGGVSAWLASSVSLAGLLVAKASKNALVFWWAFGGGMGLRLATLAALMAYGTSHDCALSQPALLLAYVFGVLFFLLMESRHIKLK